MTLGELLAFCKDYCVSIIIGRDGNGTDPIRIGSLWPDNYWSNVPSSWREGDQSRLGKTLRESAKDEVKKLNLDEFIIFCERNGVSLTISYDIHSDSAIVRMKSIDYRCQYEMFVSSLCADMVSDKNEYFQSILVYLKEKIDDAISKYRRRSEMSEYPKPSFIIP